MSFRAEYEVRELPKDFVTKEMKYTFVDDEKATPDRFGRKRQKMVSELVDSHGGWLFIVKGKPGHSIRLTSLEQIEAMKLAVVPRRIDEQTGEEVDERGVPISVAHLVNGGQVQTTGRHSTDVDVQTSDDDLGNVSDPTDIADAAESVVSNQIAKLE